MERGSKISFIIPAYNEESLIGKCLESIQRELARGAYEAEVVVVDNGSTDRTLEAARSFAGARAEEGPRRGANSARKAGWEASSGELVACIDADTELTLVWVDTVIHEFSRDPKLAALTGPFIYRDLPLYLRALVRALYVIAFLLQTLSKPFIHAGAMLQGGNFVLRRRMFDAVGGFNTDIVFYGDDADTAMRIERVGKVR